MKKSLFALTLAALTFTVPPAEAAGPPAANVDCALIDKGVRYGASLIFTGSTLAFNSLTYDWEYAIATPGSNPQLTSSYGPRGLIERTDGNALVLSYESMLALAKNDPSANIIVFANSIFSDGLSTLVNKTGTGCYVGLPQVLANKEVAAAQKVADEKAAADKAVKDAAAEAEKIAAALAKAEEAKKAQDTVAALAKRTDLIMRVTATDIEITMKTVQALSKIGGNKAALNKFLAGKPKVPSLDNATLEEIETLATALSSFIASYDKFLTSGVLNPSKTITCAKGKTLKKVTAAKPKCPAGYRLK